MRLFIILIVAMFVGCQKPSDFELTNTNDPESPDFVLSPATAFSAVFIYVGEFRLTWSGGASNRAEVDIIRISGADTLQMFNDVPTGNEFIYVPEDFPSSPFRFAFRMTVNDTSSAWRFSNTFRYQITNPIFQTLVGSDSGIRMTWSRQAPGIFSSSGIHPTTIFLPNDTVTVEKSVNGGSYELMATSTDSLSFFDADVPALADVVRYRLRGHFKGSMSTTVLSDPIRIDYTMTETSVIPLNHEHYLQDVDQQNGFALFSDFSTIALRVADLEREAIHAVLDVGSAIPECATCGWWPKATFGDENEVFFSYGHRIHRWNPSTGDIDLVTELGNDGEIHQMVYDKASKNLIAILVRNDVASKSIHQIDVPTGVTSLLVNYVGQSSEPWIVRSPQDEFVFVITGTFNGSVQDVLYIPLSEPENHTTFTIIGELGTPVFDSALNEVVMLFPHQTAGLWRRRMNGTIQQFLSEFGKVNDVYHKTSTDELYLQRTANRIVVLDPANGYALKRSLTSTTQIKTYEHFDWNGRLFRSESSLINIREFTEPTVWFRGNTVQP
jgi:hypothetical protein